MVFAHDTETALTAAAVLVNTGSDDDTMTTLEQLDAFVREQRYTGARAHDEAELAGVRALRDRLRRLWSLEPEDLVREVNAMLREGGALPQLVAHDGWSYHLHATPDDAPLADRIAVEAAMAFVDVVRQDELDRLRTCAADDCADVVVDLSKNRSRRYCGTACANRINVAAFRARQRG